MPWKTYAEYCDYMEARGWQPAIEEVWRREYAPKDDAPAPMVITPRNRARPVEPTLAAHAEGERRKAPGKKPLPPRRVKVYTPQQLRERKNAARAEKRKAEREAAGLPPPMPRVKRSEMSAEELAEHKRKLRRDRDARRRDRIKNDPQLRRAYRETNRIHSRESKRRMRQDPQRYAQELERNRTCRKGGASAASGCAA